MKSNQVRRQAMRNQKLIGLVFLILAAVVFVLAATGSTPLERDATAAILFAPLGAWLMVSRHQIIV